uniref:Uncharacterized protein n=1 Tax=Cacopsylla melanoneura TaxID=428564 RepID=A0A8D9E8R0_9HEMI
MFCAAFVTMKATPTMNVVILVLFVASVIQSMSARQLFRKGDYVEGLQQYRPERFSKIDIEDSRGEEVRYATLDNTRGREAEQYRPFRDFGAIFDTIPGHTIPEDETVLDFRTHTIVTDKIPFETQPQIPSQITDKGILTLDNLPVKRHTNDSRGGSLWEKTQSSLLDGKLDTNILINANVTNQTVNMNTVETNDAVTTDYKTLVHRSIFKQEVNTDDDIDRDIKLTVDETKKLNMFIAIIVIVCIIWFCINIIICIIQLFFGDN